jgi:hypothetical protein
LQKEVTMSQPYSSSGQPAGPLRPAAPAPVRTAVKLMYAGAAVSIVPLIIALATPIADDISAYHLTVLGQHLTAAQISQWRPLIITVVTVAGLVVPAVWLWMARANGQGRNWARIVSTLLFGLATLHLAGNNGVVQVVLAVLAWLVGLAVVWLLWRPASSAFFNGRVSPAGAAWS